MKNIVVLDFGGTAAVIAARKLRGARVFSRIVDANAVSMDVLTGDTAGIVIAGNDERDADSWSKLPTELMQAGVPVLALGIPAVLSVYFDVFSGFVQALVFTLLSMVYISGACPPPDEK